MNLRLVDLDPDLFYPPHVLVTDEPDALRLEVDLTSGEDMRFALRERPHAAVAYILSSTYRERGAVRASFYPLIAFAETPDVEALLGILNCCKWSERMLESDWERDGRYYEVYGCRLTERYLLEFVYGLYREGGFVIPGHLGECQASEWAQPFHIDVAEGRRYGLDSQSVAAIRRHYACSLSNALARMGPREREFWGVLEEAS